MFVGVGGVTLYGGPAGRHTLVVELWLTLADAVDLWSSPAQDNTLWYNVEYIFSPQSMDFPIVWCAVNSGHPAEEALEVVTGIWHEPESHDPGLRSSDPGFPLT